MQRKNTQENTMSKLKDQVAVVTGASKGIGAGIAKALAAEGASVVVNYSSSKAGAETVVAEIVKKGGKAIAVQADVSKQADITRLFAETKKAYGRLDILVNNAGVYVFSPLEGINEEFFRNQFDLNVLGLLLTTKESLKLFGDNGGSIINIGSIASTMAPPNASVYVATKAAVDGIRRSHRRLRRERFPQVDRVHSPARPHRPNGRHLAHSGVSRLFRFQIYDRRNSPSRWRSKIIFFGQQISGDRWAAQAAHGCLTLDIALKQSSSQSSDANANQS
jgi:NADP-dependent 3-hydroxy acid dehydrogenase YdfG